MKKLDKRITHDKLLSYIQNELPAHEAQEIGNLLETDSVLQKELAMIKELKSSIQNLSAQDFHSENKHKSKRAPYFLVPAMCTFFLIVGTFVGIYLQKTVLNPTSSVELEITSYESPEKESIGTESSTEKFSVSGHQTGRNIL